MGKVWNAFKNDEKYMKKDIIVGFADSESTDTILGFKTDDTWGFKKDFEGL